MVLELAGYALLGVGVLASISVLLATWQLHGRYPTVENATLLCLALGHAYSTATFLVGAIVPLRVVYENPDLLEMMHRSRYLTFDCAALPCVLWLLVELARGSKQDGDMLGLIVAALPEGPVASGVQYALLACAHLVLGGLAARDCARYPFTTENCLGVLYWRPARFTQRMRRPWLCVTRALWALGLYRCLALGRPALLAAAAALRLAFHGHMSHWRHWSWEIFAQPPAAALLCTALLLALGTALRCDWRSLNPASCILVAPDGPVALFSAGGRIGLSF